VKLLFLTPQLPFPPQQGTTLRNFNILKQLALRHEIHLLTFGTPAQLRASPLLELCARVEIVPPPARSTLQRAIETLGHPLPDMARRLHSPDLAQKLAQLLDAHSYNGIQIEGIEMAAFLLGIPRPTVPVVFDDHNAEWSLQKTAYDIDRRTPRRLHAAFYSWIQYRKLRRFERAVCLASSAVVTVSDPDARSLVDLDARIQPVIVPNGVDVEYFVPSTEVCAKPLAELSVVFTGKMDFRPNVDAARWFADEILPALRREIPLAHVSFVGQQPSPAVLALKRRPGIEVTGRVSDTRPFIADAAVFCVPLRMGSGTRLKVLEAMAMGKAIVSTSLGVSGIACENGRDVWIADTAPEFARAIAALLRDRARAFDLGAHARQLAEAHYDWRALVPQFEPLYARMGPPAAG
jgi:sugar transferase (PEP-CTERM/EpsH1 system associated)